MEKINRRNMILKCIIILMNLLNLAKAENNSQTLPTYDVVFPIRDLRGHREAVTYIDISPSQKYIVSASQDTNLILRVLKNSKIKKVIVGHKAPISAVKFSPDEQSIASCDTNGIVEIWDISGNNLKTLSTKNLVFYSLAFSNSGNLLACGSSGSIVIWTHPEGNLYREIKTENSAVNSIVFNQDDSYIIAGLSSGEIKIIRIADSKEILNIKAHKDAVKSISYLQNKIASCSMDGYLAIWNFSDGKNLFSTIAHQAGCKSVSFSEDGKYILTAGMDNYAKLWEMDKKQPLKLFGGHIGPVNAAVFSKKYIITGGDDKTIKIWLYKEGNK